MIWLILLLYAIFIYYFIVKSDSKPHAKVLSVLSGLFLILILTPMWSFSLFVTFINLSLFSPFILVQSELY